MWVENKMNRACFSSREIGDEGLKVAGAI
jgi:hypothetical protein